MTRQDGSINVLLIAVVRVSLIVAALIPFWMLVPADARTELIVIDFEGLDAMTFFSGNPIPDSARLSDAFLPTHGVRFSSGSPYVAVVDLGVGHATSGTNGIGGSTPAGVLTYDRQYPIVISFFDPGNPSVPAVTDFVSVRGDNGGSGLPITLNAFDVEGNLIASFTTVDAGGATLTVAAVGIHSVQFVGTRDEEGGVALDDLTFNPVTPVSVAAVDIDVEPRNQTNSVNPGRGGKIAVAILTTSAFDSATVDTSTVLFGRTGIEAAPIQDAMEDVDRDGDLDLVLRFNMKETGLTCADVSAVLTAETFDGQALEGSDAIRPVGCK
jgi:hypothetical protein